VNIFPINIIAQIEKKNSSENLKNWPNGLRKTKGGGELWNEYKSICDRTSLWLEPMRVAI
jgi:hypothetical protein